MSGIWEGYWQVVYDSDGEEIVEFRNTTTAVRPALGFSVFAGGHFLELRSTAARRPPDDWPPTREEAISMLRDFSAFAGGSAWREDGSAWVSESTVSMAGDPRLEGTLVRHILQVEGETARCERTIERAGPVTETWRRLSGAGDTPLAGAWESGDPDDLWMYLVTQGHYGVIRTSSDRPRAPGDGEEFSDDEMFALWEGFGANCGSRLETEGSFDHWPMLAQVAGYEIRKHETFRLSTVGPDRFAAFIPPYEESGEEWRRLG